MKIVLAQGNPGAEYSNTRHNIGWTILDELAASHDATFLLQTKFSAHIATLAIRGEKALLVKPTTFYNETGRSARALLDFYKLTPEDFLVLHDDLSLPFGTIRIRNSGSDAGNNGVKSITSHIGSSYWRIRLGIWNDLRDKQHDANFVLARFTQDEHAALKKYILPRATTAIDTFCEGAIAATSIQTIDTI